MSNVIKCNYVDMKNHQKNLLLCEDDPTEEIIEKAKEEAELIKEQAYKEGFEAGKKEADKLKLDVNRLKKQAQERLEEIENEKLVALKEVEDEIGNLIYEVTEKIIGNKIENEKDTILCVLKIALSKLSGKRDLKVRVCDEDYDIIMDHKKDIFKIIKVEEVDFLKDTALKPGDCIIETPLGIMDYSVSNQLKVLKKEFETVS